MFNNRTGAVVSTSTTISNTKRTGTITTNRLRNVIVRTYGVGCVVLTTRAGEMPNVGHLARTEVTWYGIGVYSILLAVRGVTWYPRDRAS